MDGVQISDAAGFCDRNLAFARHEKNKPGRHARQLLIDLAYLAPRGRLLFLSSFCVMVFAFGSDAVPPKIGGSHG